ncbi:hypothetical protein HCN44_006388 [Aphidius gifuensis]|uniref:Cytochrome b5 heme-binding domain-containing protein n=1 Tax=Aphidius gifuensis TaxID=684658 RepID=A0A834XTS2_APHGI|nr:cytochrome b5-like [Aphidius gifuensis]KAF7993328.1 hypothetical protein HCN44_006388 [Aphidius gifuensis]
MTGALYTRKQVSQHNGQIEERIWTIYKNSVYDITDFLNEHPGGPELLMECAGKDMTSDFDDAGHSSHAMSLLKPLKIGDLVEDDKIGNTRKNKIQKSIGNIQKSENTKRKNRRLLFPLFRSCSA